MTGSIISHIKFAVYRIYVTRNVRALMLGNSWVPGVLGNARNVRDGKICL